MCNCQSFSMLHETNTNWLHIMKICEHLLLSISYHICKIYVKDWMLIVKKISYLYIFFFPYISTLWILPFFFFLMMSKGGESVCLCFVLKLFQVIKLQNKGGDIQDRGSFNEQTLSKGYGLSSSKRGRLWRRFPS